MVTRDSDVDRCLEAQITCIRYFFFFSFTFKNIKREYHETVLFYNLCSFEKPTKRWDKLKHVTSDFIAAIEAIVCVDPGTSELKIEEIEVLCSIYGDEWKTDNTAERSYNIEIVQDELNVTLYITLPESYPFESPPLYTLLAPCLTKEEKNLLGNQLNEVYLENIGQNVLYQWIEKIRENLSTLAIKKINPEIPDSSALKVNEVNPPYEEDELPKIIHGEAICDRKSTFQAHVATVVSSNQVKQVLSKLKENKKIENATHNMYAYRISKGDSAFIQDCDDDGETQAGGRLLHLLQIVGATNVLVIVSRWYGGIQLGPDRFRHINNAARQVLEQAGCINNDRKKKS